MGYMKCPRCAKLLVRDNVCYPIVKIHFETNKITLQEKVFTTVNFTNVEFYFSDFTNEERVEFCKYLEKAGYKNSFDDIIYMKI